MPSYGYLHTTFALLGRPGVDRGTVVP